MAETRPYIGTFLASKEGGPIEQYALVGIKNSTLFRAYLAADQAIPHNTITVVAGYTKSFDVGNNFNAATGIYTAPVSGYYKVDATIMFFDAEIKLIYAAAFVNKNGATASVGNYWSGPIAQFVGSSVGDVVYLLAGETLSIAGWMQTSDFSAAVMYGGSYTHFCVYLVSKG